MFYLIETEYVGPNQQDPRYIDSHTFEIATKPPVGNMDGRDIVDGWCGTTNDWAVYGRGAFETLEAAEQEVRRRLDDHGYRQDDLEARDDVDRYQDEQSGIVARFRVGSYEPLSTEDTRYLMDGGMFTDTIAQSVDATMSDDELKRVHDLKVLAWQDEQGQQPDEATLWQMLLDERNAQYEEMVEAEQEQSSSLSP